MNHNCYFWYDANNSSLYIDPIQLSMNLPIFLEKITKAELIVPNHTERLPVIFPQGSERIENTPYKRFLGHSYRCFLRMHVEDIYEYRFQLENGMVVSNIGHGILIENASLSFINLCLFNLMADWILVEKWEPFRFYRIQDGVITPTEHVTSDPVVHICGLYMQEIFE